MAAGYIDKLIDEIYACPGLTVGCTSLRGLWHFLHGVLYVDFKHHFISDDSAGALGDFSHWLAATKYPDAGGGEGWATLIQRHTRDEEEAWRSFYELFKEFRDNSAARREGA